MGKRIGTFVLALVMVLSLVLGYLPSQNIALADEVDYPVQIKVHYTREDNNYEGWNVFQWGGAEVTPFEVGEGEAVATISAYANPGDIGFIVRYSSADNEWADREWVTEESGDRSVLAAFPRLSEVKSGTIHVYVDHADPSVTTAEADDDVIYGEADVVEYDIDINVHYYREDGDYSNWEVHMWNGVESLDSTRKFDDETVEYDGKQWAVAHYHADASDIWVGFIIKTPDWTKDPDGDRKIDISDVTGGTVNVYAVAGSALEDFTVDKSNADLGGKVTAAVYDYQTSTIDITTSYPLDEVGIDTFTLTGPDGAMMTITQVETLDDTTYRVTYEGTIDETGVYTISYNGVSCTVTIPNTYSSEQFEAENTYTGNDLGASWSAESTTFRVWAPTAAAVSVNLYESGTAGTDDQIDTVEMTKDVNGTWVVTVEGNLNGTYYTYSVTRKGETVEACDPYARTTGVNGNRAMVIDLDSTDPEGWAADSYVTQDNYTDAVIWELHVRDFSIDESSGMVNKGKYLAFTEEGTTVSGKGEIATGVDYIRELGVNYVHLLPVYDINSVDETTGGYNWGYDPKNYNVPEGSYSTDPYNGEVRVKEFKQMVQSLHDNGIGVIMDVVYNHVADAGQFCFNQIVPGYFSRIHDDGSYQSDSGCGNDTASERSMVSKYIADSVLYWCEEYHIDGFRWDLVGLIDYETINETMRRVHAVNPDIVFYGEGWEMCGWTTKEDGEVPYSQKMTIQPNDKKVNTEAGTFAFFNDTIRNVIHGGVFTATDKGFVSGNMTEGTQQTVVDSYMAYSNWGSDGARVDTPLQTVNYASCHDNYTLFDNLTIDVMDMNGVTAAEAADLAADMNNLAAAYYITAQGVPFIHAGEEALRSKPDSAQSNGFNHNSYAAGDTINSFKWSALETELVAESHDYYQGLIAFRQAHAAMRMTSQSEILEAMSVIDQGNPNVSVILNEGGNGEDAKILSIFNADAAAQTVTLPEGKWNVYVNKASAGTEILETVEGTIEVESTSAMILVAAEAGSAPEDPEDPETADVQRVAGAARHSTAIASANAMKEALGVEEFNAIILATGGNFADAQAGSYLGAVKTAPILLYLNKSEEENLPYVQENLAANGTLYILGGETAVPADVEQAYKDAGINVVRLAGDTRFETNLLILEEAGVEDREILITSGVNYPDALSVSATGLPVLMVGGTQLSEAQKDFLAEHKDNQITIIGGTAAVSEEMQEAVEAVVEKDVDRIYGADRVETSVAIAKAYFAAPEFAVVAYSLNFPDGLSGGPLAYVLKAPMLLTSVNAAQLEVTNAYIEEMGITAGYIMGGTNVITDAAARTVFGLASDATIPNA